MIIVSVWIMVLLAASLVFNVVVGTILFEKKDKSYAFLALMLGITMACFALWIFAWTMRIFNLI